MNFLDKMKNEVKNLSNEDYTKFRKWFTEYDAKIWDEKIENDIKAGKLDKIAKEAIKEYKSGKFKEL